MFGMYGTEEVIQSSFLDLQKVSIHVLIYLVYLCVVAQVNEPI